MLIFVSPAGYKPGIFLDMLRKTYAEMVQSNPTHWLPQLDNWKQFDRDVFEEPDTVGDSVFVSLADGIPVGFGSWDPRQWPELGIVGHNCIVPKHQGKGFGNLQIMEILSHFRKIGMKSARVTTHEHPFFVPAQKMYLACGFVQAKRYPWEIDPSQNLIDYTLKLE